MLICLSADEAICKHGSVMTDEVLLKPRAVSGESQTGGKAAYKDFYCKLNQIKISHNITTDGFQFSLIYHL
ncbi:hypothetical protein FHR87_001485 [Azomonas macrocytogenes]|uniref:Uncharacterized protein n=1 Tax=Azomonas macrocytogenes TaxID=69962 RepID=A0A839T348_AZOMA|nr:hypothetical protein [Azomonas macrocytogenes]